MRKRPMGIYAHYQRIYGHLCALPTDFIFATNAYARTSTSHHKARTSPTSISMSRPAGREAPPQYKGEDEVKEPNINDVLCGRGVALVENPGNIQFDALIDERRPIYADASTKGKTLIINEIVRYVMTADPPGRFLKADDDGWKIMGYEKARERVRRALKAKDNQNALEQASAMIPSSGIASSSEASSKKSDESRRLKIHWLRASMYAHRGSLLAILCVIVLARSWQNSREHLGIEGNAVADAFIDITLTLTSIVLFQLRLNRREETTRNENVKDLRLAALLGVATFTYFGSGGMSGLRISFEHHMTR